jgi:electron transport complex protein RnfE
MGLLIAFKNVVDKWMEKRLSAQTENKVVERARVTGTDI